MNLLEIAIASEKQEERFFELLEQTIYQVFEMVEAKTHILGKNLSQFSDWNHFTQIILENHDPFKDSLSSEISECSTSLIAAISYYGLDECVFVLTGLPIKDQENSRKKAGEILNYIARLIKKQNENPQVQCQFVLAEPHPIPAILIPNDTYLDQIAESYNNLKQWTPTQYSFVMQFARTSLKLKTLLQIYEDLKPQEDEGPSLNLFLGSDKFLVGFHNITSNIPKCISNKSPRYFFFTRL